MPVVAVLRRNRIQIGSEREAGQVRFLMVCGLRQLTAEHLRGSGNPNRRTRGMRSALRNARKDRTGSARRSCHNTGRRVPGPLLQRAGRFGGGSDAQRTSVHGNRKKADYVARREPYAECHGHGSYGQRRNWRAALRSALTVTAPRSLAEGRGRDEGRIGQDFGGLRRVKKRAWVEKDFRFTDSIGGLQVARGRQPE
jgi:hypothetical protein